MPGRILLDLAPSAGNPRNSEGAFLRLQNGNLRLYYSRFLGDSSADEAYAAIAYVETCDEGETWSAPQTVFTAQELHAVNIMSVSVLDMANGDKGLFFLVRESGQEMYPVLWRSSDDCRTWQGPVRCIPEHGYFVVNNDRVIRTKSGRILIPAAQHGLVVKSSGSGWNMAYGVDRFACSDDDGRSWFMLPGTVRESSRVCSSGLQEPGLAERKDGTLMGFARTDLGRQYEFFSADGGSSWSRPEPAWFSSPCSPMQIKRMPDGRMMAVWNPIPAYQTRKLVPVPGYPGRYSDRTRYVFAISSDDGESWSEPVIFEDDDRAGYSYPAMHFTDRGVFLAYCAGSHEDGGNLCRERIRFIPYEELKTAQN